MKQIAISRFSTIAWLLLFFLLAERPGLFGQRNGNLQVSTRVVVAEKNVVQLATVALLRAQDSAFVKAGVPDEAGNVTIQNLNAGRYLLCASLNGYQKQYSAAFDLQEGDNNLSLPDLSLSENVKELRELTVSAKKPYIERKLDRLIVNVDNSIVNAGSTALEVLERAPNLNVSQETGIQMRGKSGVIVLIDGRPTPLAGADLINYLRTIPSANLDRVELITNPSAKYDAAGNAGILDIRFKKDKNEGLNGNLNLSYGQGFYAKPSGSLNLNFRNKKWNLYGNYAYSLPKNFTRFYINRTFYEPDRSVNSNFDQTSFIEQPITSQNAKIGLDYYASKRTIVGLMFNGNLTHSDRDGQTRSVISNPNGALLYVNESANFLKSTNLNGFANANLKHDFNGKGMELTIDFDLGKYRADNFQNVRSAYFDAFGALSKDELLETDQGGIITLQSLKADYVLPIGQTSKLEAGLKSGFVKTDNDILFYDVTDGEQLLDSLRSNHFIYDENVNAAYLNYSREMKKFDFQVGLRTEHTRTNGQQITTNQQFKRNYVNFFPSLSLNHKFTAQYQLGLSYSRRIDRPSYRQLNPFRIFVDPYTYVVGDPQLKPVFTDALELSHTIRGRYIATMAYSRSHEVITDVFEQDDETKISNQIPANLQNFDFVSLGLSLPFSVGKWMNSNFSAETYWGRYDTPLQGGQLVQEFVTWNARLNNSFTLGKKGWSAEINAMYRAQEPWGLFIIRNLGALSAGLQKVSADKKSTFKISATDILLTNRIAVIVDYQNMDFHTMRTWDSRVVTLSYAYRFGKKTVAQARRRNSGVEDEKRRAN